MHTISFELINNMKGFESLGLSEPFLELLEREKFAKPSEIQEKAIPLILQGRDIIGNSATGSGKTLAFGAGIIERTEKGKGIQNLILTPTRELAEQIGNFFKKFSEFKDLNTAIIYGGVNIRHQINELRNSEIVVGTPGRILDHLERGTINFSNLKVLVFDEADRMLDMGFLRDVEKITMNCPRDRQTLLFSATISADVRNLEDKYMRNPESVSFESQVNPSKLKQIYYDVPRGLKFSLLVHLLKKEDQKLVMVFCNTRNNTDFVARNLVNLKVDTLAIHGGLTQDKRTKIMRKFNNRHTCVIVCTDVAARGLDIKGVSHVYNYDIPKSSSDYVHRIGRTARAGNEGIAINLLCDRDYENFSNILRDSEAEIKEEKLPKIERVRMMLENKRNVRRNRWDSDNWRERNSARGRSAPRQRQGGRRNSNSKRDTGSSRRNFGRKRY